MTKLQLLATFLHINLFPCRTTATVTNYNKDQLYTEHHIDTVKHRRLYKRNILMIDSRLPWQREQHLGCSYYKNNRSMCQLAVVTSSYLPCAISPAANNLPALFCARQDVYCFCLYSVELAHNYELCNQPCTAISLVAFLSMKFCETCMKR